MQSGMASALAALLVGAAVVEAPAGVPDSAEIGRIDRLAARSQAVRVKVLEGRWIVRHARVDADGIQPAVDGGARMELARNRPDAPKDLVAPAPDRPIPWERIERIERGRHDVLMGAVWGAVGGLAAAGLVNALDSNSLVKPSERRDRFAVAVGSSIAIGAALSLVTLDWKRIYPR